MVASSPLVAHGGGGALTGSLWLPDPPICTALLAAGAAVASYDKRGVGESAGSWLTAGIPDQADDAVAGLAVARRALAETLDDAAPVPGVLFGHSQGGWVILEAAGRTGPRAW